MDGAGQGLDEEGAEVLVYDPPASENAKAALDGRCRSVNSLVQGLPDCDVVVLIDPAQNPALGAGDGFLALFDSSARAIACAHAAQDRVRELGLQIRCGLHMGQLERQPDGSAGGIAVHDWR